MAERSRAKQAEVEFDAALSALCQRLIDDMTLRGFGEKTQHDQIRIVSRFAGFLGDRRRARPPENIRRFQLEQREAGAPAPALNSHVAALRFFFTTTPDRPDLSRKLIRTPYPRKLPTVLSPVEVARLLVAITCVKHRAALSVAHGAGLRVAEVASLKVGDIDSQRMLIRVERGTRGRYRNAMLSPDLLALLGAWWVEGKRAKTPRLRSNFASSQAVVAGLARIIHHPSPWPKKVRRSLVNRSPAARATLSDPRPGN